MKGVDNMLNFEKYKETIKGISINSFAMKDGKVKVCEKMNFLVILTKSILKIKWKSF